MIILCVALGTASLAAIGLMSSAILEGVRGAARLSIGGDVSLRLFHAPPTPAHVAAFAAAGRASLTAELRPLAHHRGSSALVELKAVDEAYPLYGALEIEPPIDPAHALARRDGIWGAIAAEPLLGALQASVGDIITIGGHLFQIRATLKTEPDGSLRAFALGPRLIVALPAIAGSEIVATGTQTYWYARLRLYSQIQAASWIATFDKTFPDAGFRIVNADDGVPGVERSLAMVTSALNFVAMGIMLVGCMGIGGSISAYLGRKREIIATLKSVGARSGLIFRLFLAQLVIAAMAGIVIGLAIGSLAFLVLSPLLADALPIETRLQARPLLVAGAFALLATLLFALWPLAKAEVMSPQALRRQDLTLTRRQPENRRPKVRRMAAIGLIGLLLLLLIVASAPLPVIAAVFTAGALVITLLFSALGRIVALAARQTGRMWTARGPLVRLALANMHRPGTPTAPLVMAMGLSLTLIVWVAALRENMVRHLDTTLADAAPDLVLLNLAPEEGGRFDSEMSASTDIQRWKRVPFLHARITRIGGQHVSERGVPAEMAFIIRGDRGLSWRESPPEGGIVAGAWWPAGYDGPPLLSLDQRVARRLGVGIGDSLTLTILGSPLEARIANLRVVDWSGLDIDFPILLSPPRETPQHREIAALWIEAGKLRQVQTRLARLFPDAPSLQVGEIVALLATFSAGAGAVLMAASAATGIAALLVLGGSVSASQRQRLREAVLLKVLGATRGQVLTASAIEFLLAGLVTAAMALLLGNLVAWAAMRELLDFRLVLGAAMPWIALALALVAGIGWLAAWLALAQPAAPVLRQD